MIATPQRTKELWNQQSHLRNLRGGGGGVTRAHRVGGGGYLVPLLRANPVPLTSINTNDELGATMSVPTKNQDARQGRVVPVLYQGSRQTRKLSDSKSTRQRKSAQRTQKGCLGPRPYVHTHACAA